MQFNDLVMIEFKSKITKKPGVKAKNSNHLEIEIEKDQTKQF